MAKLIKPLPEFKTKEEEADYWDSHSVLEHFDEKDFERFYAKRPKDAPLTIRLDSDSRKILEEIARTKNLGPSTLARTIITSALEQWKEKRELPELTGNFEPDEFKQEVEKLFSESKAGNVYVLPESRLETLSKTLIRDFFGAAGYKVTPDVKRKTGVKRKVAE